MLEKTYEHKRVEDKIYQLWQKSGFFNPDNLPKNYKLKTKNYCIVIPPPNITGELHMGHALNATLQDILIRKKRMEGFKTLWLPGTDHAGIATQNVVERELKKEGKTRFDLGREKFIERVWQWKQEYGNKILSQFKKLGASCDWSRTRFTMDSDYAKAVEAAFLHYYKKGWIYQGERVVNWCPRCQTSLSDLELEYKEEKAKLYWIKYGPFILATTRPETKLGDTAVAVHPDDKRYKGMVGKECEISGALGKFKIKVVADRTVDPKFGSGAVKVTPAHSIVDSEIAERHNVPFKQIIDQNGRMMENCGKYAGMKTNEAREEIVKDMEKMGLIDHVDENYIHNIALCYRCGSIIENLPSVQWFLKMEKLAKSAIKPVKEGKIKFHPKNFQKPYFNWLENIKDWCISRQLWWGHRLPVYVKQEEIRNSKLEIYVGNNPPNDYIQVPDVLDTWFSSALWPFATLGWPKKTKDLRTFYPTQVLSTARDIINLWVARMIFSGLEFMKKVPFSTVIIHPTVLTKEGRRMSKSLGTGIDPIGLCEKYGADATRFGIAWQLQGLQDVKFTEDNIVMGRKFCNKLWNASRFVLSQINGYPISINLDLGKSDIPIINQLNKTAKSVNKDIENYQFGKAAHTLYDFFWHDFCDIYIEKSKMQKDKENTQKTLLYVLLNSVRLLHPFIPFITEEIYQQLPMKNKKKSLMVEQWPNV